MKTATNPAGLGKIYIRIKNEGNQFDCPICGKKHDKIWFIYRKIHAVTNYPAAYVNGEFRAIDATLPLDVDKLPTAGVHFVPIKEAAEMWHKEAHHFG